MTNYVVVLHNMALNQRKRDAESGIVNPLLNTARLLDGAAEHIKRLEAENAALRRERDDALRAAEASRVRQEIEVEPRVNGKDTERIMK